MEQGNKSGRGLLAAIEEAGNRLPNPTMLFVYLCGLILFLSAVAAFWNVQAVHPVTGETLTAVNLLTREGLHLILGNAVSNFTGFAPVGTVLVAIMGIGVAEHSGLLSALLRMIVMRAHARWLTFIVVVSGVLSSLAADTGYVVLLPLAGMVFAVAGRNPVAGIAAAFAGVSGGFSANLMIGPLDAILAGISTEAAALVDPTYEVSAAGNYYFIVCSTLLIGGLGTLVTEKLVEPQLTAGESIADPIEHLTADERRGLQGAGWFTLLVFGLLLWALFPADGLLRDAATGGILRSPFISGLVVIIATYAALAGLVFGKVSGSFSSSDDVVAGMEKSMETMAGYLVLMFFAAQFINYFAWSQLGVIAAITGAELLQSLELHAVTLLLTFVVFAAAINLLVGSASAKWALMAPIFVPMLLLNGISPEATQVAYRVGDSSTNIITPLMPYFGVVVAFVQRYDKSAGIGTIIAMMLPYSIAFLFGWSLLLALWVFLSWPLGPGAPVYLP